MAKTASAPSCMSTENGCVMFDCLVHIWEWLDPPLPNSQYEMENKKNLPATQQPLLQQHLLAHHVHPEQIYKHQYQMTSQYNSPQSNQLQPNGVMHQLLQSQYHSNIDARSPLLENRQELYGTGQNVEFARQYTDNDNINYAQSPGRSEKTDIPMDHNVNHELIQNIPKGYNPEVHQDYLKRNPPRESNQIYQNHEPTYSPNVNQQYGSKPYLPFSNRTGPQSNTELLRRQYNEIQQLKLQQQMNYQNQAQMQQQQKFAQRQILLQQIHGVQPPPNLQNNIYFEGSSRNLSQYGSRKDFKEFSSDDIQKELDRYVANNELKELEWKNRQSQDLQWQLNQATDHRDSDRSRKQSEGDKSKSQSPPTDFSHQNQKNNVGVISPMKSSVSSSPSIRSPSSDSRKSSGGTQALRSPVALRTPSAPVTISGVLYKQGSDGLKVWRKRWFVLSEYCLFYYKNEDEEKLLGSVLLPSYKVSPCSSEDKVLRKYAFKLEHANMRTYVLAAPDQDFMLRWVKALTMAALMQNLHDQHHNQSERTALKKEDTDDIPGPTYANAPPKPRRSNEGYTSPGPDTYDPNYDMLKKKPTHLNHGTSNNRYQEHLNYPISPKQDITQKSPQSPLLTQPHPPQYKRPYQTNHLSLSLTNSVGERIEPNQQKSIYGTTKSPYVEDRSHNQLPQNNKADRIYDRQPTRNPFSQEISPENTRESELQQNQNIILSDMDRNKLISNDHSDIYSREIYGELNSRISRPGSVNERLLAERRTPDAYGRSTSLSSYNRNKMGDYEDIYTAYTGDNEYGQTYIKSPNDTALIHQNHMGEKQSNGTTVSEKNFSGPSVLRRKKMQASGIQPQVPRPHSADFLEYEARQEMLNKTLPSRSGLEPPKQPQRPKSSLDINSYYDPSSDKYYSEESYAEKMRQSAQYLQQGLGPKNIQIPLAKYASGLAEKQLHSPYFQNANNEVGFGKRTTREGNGNVKQHQQTDEINSNWTLKEKSGEVPKDYLNRSVSVIGDEANITGFSKDNRHEVIDESFIRSASARLPSSNEREGEFKEQQREESMKRLLEWKQRMLQSPLTRKSTPAAISLARSLNQNRQSLRTDQLKSKNYTNASYNSYSSDDEEETSSTELKKQREVQAGRSHRVTHTSPATNQTKPPHASDETDISVAPKELENTYENILCTISVPKIQDLVDNSNDNIYSNDNFISQQISCDESDGYETNDSEAESEGQLEYTDNDLDEVLLECDNETSNITSKENNDSPNVDNTYETNVEPTKSTTPPLNISSEDHYLPMSPRKTSIIEPAHKTIIESISVFDETMPVHHEDSPYVEMNLGTEEEDMQTYEDVCINNSKVEPVYMELTNVTSVFQSEYDSTEYKSLQDMASNFAEPKEHTLKRIAKTDKLVNSPCENLSPLVFKDTKSDQSDIDEEGSKDITLDSSYQRMSISDTFRPASYYLSRSRSALDRQDSSESDIPSSPLIISSSASNSELSHEALSQYVLDKLSQSDLSQESSILKMLTKENQTTSRKKKKTTSLMIYGSHTSIHDTLTRGEKIRNSRASLNQERNKVIDSPILSTTIIENYTSSVETDSLKSYNADRGSSRLSLESDVSSKFEMIPSNLSSEVASLNESELAIEFRDTKSSNLEMIMKRRPLSENSLFHLEIAETLNTDISPNLDFDRYLDILQPSTSSTIASNFHYDNLDSIHSFRKDNIAQAATLKSVSHMRSSSTPVYHDQKLSSLREERVQSNHYKDNFSNSCSPSELQRSPLSYYCKHLNEEDLLGKNLNSDDQSDKIKEFESIKSPLISSSDTNASTSTTGFHSRESSTEHSAPYYYSDLSSQEHINVLPTSHYLKNTNLHRKLNNQRRRGPLLKKNDISHIHNPIRNNEYLLSDSLIDYSTAARSISVEFLSAADKDPEIDMKNIYEATRGKTSKIPASMSLLTGLGCKNNSSISTNNESSSDSNLLSNCSLNTSTAMKLSSTSMSSHCSGNSSNTVYYDAEADTNAYENIICQGENHWDEDSLWRDNLRRVSHRHARSMDDLDSAPLDTSFHSGSTHDSKSVNSIKRVKKDTFQTPSKTPTYVNCEFKGQENKLSETDNEKALLTNTNKGDDNDVYVSLSKNAHVLQQPLDEGVYEQLTVDSSDNSLVMPTTKTEHNTCTINRKRFEIDREKLRQWDLMSSGLMKVGIGRVRGLGTGEGGADPLGSMDSGAESASNDASMTIPGANNIENEIMKSTNNQTSNRAFIGSNTSIGRSTVRDTNIPVRAVSPRVRWVEEKTLHDNYGLQQISTSQQNLNILNSEDSWALTRSPSRMSQQPVRAVSPRIRRNTDNDDLHRGQRQNYQFGEIPTAGELLGRTHEELVLLLIQLRRRHAATHRAIEQCCIQISSIEDSLGSLKAAEKEESLQRLEHLKMQLLQLEHQFEKSKPLVQLVDNMVKLGSLYNRPGSTLERLERNQKLRHKVLTEHALEQQRWLECAAAGKTLETEAARVRVAELWALEQELSDEASILAGLKTDKEAIETLITDVRGKLDIVRIPRKEIMPQHQNGSMQNLKASGLEAELSRVHAMLALNSKKLEQTVAHNALLQHELQQLRMTLQPAHPAHATHMLEDEVSRVQQLVSDLQRQRQELSRAVRDLTQQSQNLHSSNDSMMNKRRPVSAWQETNLDASQNAELLENEYGWMSNSSQYRTPADTPLYVDTNIRDNMMHQHYNNLSNAEKQEIKTVRIVKRESERRQRDRERSLVPDWPSVNMASNMDHYLEEELVQSPTYRNSVATTDFSKFEEYYSKPQTDQGYQRMNDKMSTMEVSPKYPSSPSLSTYDYSRDISSLSNSYHKSYDRSSYDRNMSVSTQYLNSPSDSTRTLTNDPISKTSSVGSFTRSHMELSPIFKSEAAKQIITEMSSDVPKDRNGSLHRRQVPKEKRRHNTAPHHLSAKALNDLPKDGYNQDKLGRSLDDADMERALRSPRAPPDVVRSAIAPQRIAVSAIDQLLAAPQKILIPERYIPEKPPELSPEEQQKRLDKVESIKKMLTSSSSDPNDKSPDGEEKRQRQHLLQMNQILAKQVTEMSKIIAVKALEELPLHEENGYDSDDRSPDVELPIYQQRENFFT